MGPAENFGMFSYFSKGVLIFDMLAGRLEIFPLLLLFTKDTWKNSEDPGRGILVWHKKRFCYTVLVKTESLLCFDIKVK